MPRRLWAVLRKEFLQIFRDRRTLVLSLLIPIVLLLLFGFAVTFDVDHLKLAVVDPVRSSLGRQVRASLDATDTFDLVFEPEDPREVAGLLDSGEVDVAVVLPARMMSKLATGRRFAIQALVNGSDSTIATRAEVYLSAAMADTMTRLSRGFARLRKKPRAYPWMNAGGEVHRSPIGAEADLLRRVPQNSVEGPRAFAWGSTAARPEVRSAVGVKLEPRVLYNPALESRNFFVPGLMVIIIMLVAVLVTSMAVVRERERGTLEQLVVSPLHPLELMIGKMIPYGLITFLDVLLVLAVGYLVFGMEIKGSLALLLGIAALFLVGCLGLGLFISSVSTTQQSAFLVSMIATLLPTFILSGFIFPIESMPAPIQPFTYLVPARFFLIVVRSIIQKGVGLEIFWEQVLFLTIFALLAIGLAASRFKKRLE
jgi:ABC-2 type transport system permease protein